MNEPKKVEFPKVESGSEQVQRIADGLIGNADRVWPEDFEASGGKNVTPPGGIDDLFQG